MADEETYTHEWEAFAEGKWNGVQVTRRHLDELASNFRRLAAALKVPVKLGHNSEKLNKEKTKDGEPALGWISDVWVNAAGKLMVKATNLPKVVYEALQKKLYATTSIEALFDLEYKGEKYGTVLTAVALLGADLPAVNTLDDLQTYLASNAMGEGFAFSQRILFTQLDKEEPRMAEPTVAELQAKLAQLEAENKAKFAAQEAQLNLEREKTAKLEFETRKSAAFSKVETLVKAGKCTPGQRDKLMAEYTQDNADMVDVKIKTIEEFSAATPGSKQESFSREEAAAHDKEGTDGMALGDWLDAQAQQYADKHGVSYERGVQMTFSLHPEKARAYIDMEEV